MIPRGATGLLYRPYQVNFDRNGDPVDADGNVTRQESPDTFVGTLYGILTGGPSASTALARGEFSDTTGKFGIPTQNAYKVQFGDRLVIDGITYRVTERPDWDYPNSMSGTPPDYAWVTVEDTTSARP